jgi:hypothetical protein
MSQADQSVEWFLARDGQQHGPINAAEMNKIIELGYLLPNDLVWRQGFAEWQPAASVFPPKPASETPPAIKSATQATAPASGGSARAATSPAATQSGASKDAEAKAQPVADRAAAAQRAHTPAAKTPDPREIIAQEAARREESARRAREDFQPGGPRQAMPHTAPKAEPHRGDPSSATRDPGSRDQGLREPASRRIDPVAPPRARGPEAANQRSGPEAEGQRSRPTSTGGDDWSDEEPRRRLPRLVIASVLMIVLLGGGAFALHTTGHLDTLLTRLSFSASPQKSAAPVVVAKPNTHRQPQSGYSDNPMDVDKSFQRVELWQLLKKEFPDWYTQRVLDTARQKSEGKTDKEIAQQLAEQLVALRRKHVADALAASGQHLKSVASSFLDNLERLSRHSIDACYGFISQGETSPLIVELTQASEHRPALQQQSAAIFAAIAEGRRTPAVHKPPTREDYDKLAIQLAKRGWSPIDLQLFSDARSLARATPERVCKMVQDWFAAQLAVGEEDVQVRLLIEALKPVVAG